MGMSIREIPTQELVAELKRRLSPEEYINHAKQLEALSWEIETLAKDALCEVA